MIGKKIREINFNKKKQIHQSYLKEESIDSKKNEISNIQNNNTQYTIENNETNELEIQEIEKEITNELEEIKENNETKNTNKKK